jgi:hypothetical protein
LTELGPDNQNWRYAVSSHMHSPRGHSRLALAACPGIGSVAGSVAAFPALITLRSRPLLCASVQVSCPVRSLGVSPLGAPTTSSDSAPTTAICPNSPATQIYALFATTSASIIATAGPLAAPALVTHAPRDRRQSFPPTKGRGLMCLT